MDFSDLSLPRGFQRFIAALWISAIYRFRWISYQQIASVCLLVQRGEQRSVLSVKLRVQRGEKRSVPLSEYMQGALL